MIMDTKYNLKLVDGDLVDENDDNRVIFKKTSNPYATSYGKYEEYSYRIQDDDVETYIFKKLQDNIFPDAVFHKIEIDVLTEDGIIAYVNIIFITYENDGYVRTRECMFEHEDLALISSSDSQKYNTPVLVEDNIAHFINGDRCFLKYIQKYDDNEEIWKEFIFDGDNMTTIFSV